MAQLACPAPLVIECRELPAFNADSLDDVRRAFHCTAPCFLRQAWLEQEEPDFAPGRVRLGWQGESFLVLAELTDVDIFNRAIRFNQRAWELGDTFEIFLRPMELESYVEFQVTPDNRQLQLKYTNNGSIPGAKNGDSIMGALIREKAFFSATWVRPEARQWFVFASIPSASVCDKAGMPPASRWRFYFSRYDYTRGRAEPVISSTSPHLEANFHRQHEWGVITFQ
jgi:hypothetical protein